MKTTFDIWKQTSSDNSKGHRTNIGIAYVKKKDDFEFPQDKINTEFRFKDRAKVEILSRLF